jgi:hypothetical protein
MGLLDKLKSLVGLGDPAETTAAEEAISAEAVEVEAVAPAKAVSVVHAMLFAIETHIGISHPWIRRSVEVVDGLLEKYGEPLMAKVEHAALIALALKYPMLAPLLLQAKAQLPAPDPAPAQAPPVLPQGVQNAPKT